ncbi:hypothetical protein [Fictibacillus fluitans]|uniref:Uncharacterized protein n=1 Tax=Fictibacillus fluitans TaxID=3058422 RepID=A0ABT8HUT8_9BACL|nr:hypothetical protein [Fictibacillus sp. NE201]MDN4524542.1 hypothetical protein [Fictibacillus sp. NE201]
MLSFQEKIELIETNFPQLNRKNISLGRVNYHLEESKRDKKVVVQQLHPNGNGFVYAGHLDRRQKDDKELVNIREYSAEDLISIISNSIAYLSSEESVAAPKPKDPVKEFWTGGADNERLLLVNEDELWNIYAGLNLEAAFESYIEAHDYLVEEGFEKISSTSR